ncbi:hypothetical protein D3C79_756460 [compost metagenome]
MFKSIRLETIAVFAAVVVFILADTLLMFGFISTFDLLDRSGHQSVQHISDDVIRPSIGHAGFTGRERSGPLTTVDDAAVQILTQQLDQTQKLFFAKPKP